MEESTNSDETWSSDGIDFGSFERIVLRRVVLIAIFLMLYRCSSSDKVFAMKWAGAEFSLHPVY